MLTDDSVQLFKQSVDQAQSVFIFVSSQVKFDQVASALALFEGLKQLGKEVCLLVPSELPAKFDGLTGLENFSQQIGNKNLQVSFDYQPEMVDKVSYNIDEETQKFFLTIQPKKGTPPLDSGTVVFSYSGANVDLIITIGVTSLPSLDGLYDGYEQLFTDSNVVSIHAFETDYGTVKISSSGVSSFAETTAKLLESIGVSTTPEIAGNLLAGMEVATDDFRSASVTADTFEVVAQLMRAGGHRLPQAKVAKQVDNSLPSAFSLPQQSTNGFAQAIQQGSKSKKSSVPVSEMPRMEGGSRV